MEQYDVGKPLTLTPTFNSRGECVSIDIDGKKFVPEKPASVPEAPKIRVYGCGNGYYLESLGTALGRDKDGCAIQKVELWGDAAYALYDHMGKERVEAVKDCFTPEQKAKVVVHEYSAGYDVRVGAGMSYYMPQENADALYEHMRRERGQA